MYVTLLPLRNWDWVGCLSWRLVLEPITIQLKYKATTWTALFNLSHAAYPNEAIGYCTWYIQSQKFGGKVICISSWSPFSLHASRSTKLYMSAALVKLKVGLQLVWVEKWRNWVFTNRIEVESLSTFTFSQQHTSPHKLLHDSLAYSELTLMHFAIHNHLTTFSP